jgi:uncharacterized protein (TIRG00374 family)
MPGHLIGYALNRLLPTGNMGELAKMNYLRKVVPAQHLTASLVVATVLGTVVGQLFAVAGALVALFVLPMSIWFGLTMLIVSLAFISVTGLTLLLFRRGLVGKLTALLSRFRALRRVARYLEKAGEFDAALKKLSHFGRIDTLKAVAIFVFVRFTHVLADAAVILFMVPTLSITRAFLVGFVMATAGQLIQWALAILPAGLGAVEGGAAILMISLGLSPDVGVSVALILRIAGIIMAGMSLLAFLAPAPEGTSSTEKPPATQ